jgi:hypothetical protein
MSISSEIGKRVREYLQAANVKSRRKTLEYSVKSNKRQTFHFFVVRKIVGLKRGSVMFAVTSSYSKYFIHIP